MATVGTLALHLDHVGDRARSVVVDLRRVGFLDCLGLRVLVEPHLPWSRCGHQIEFTQGPPAVRRMFELTGTLGLLPFAETA